MRDETRARWTKLVADYEASGLTQREYTQQRGISFTTFRNWLYRLRNEARPLSETPIDNASPSSDLRLLPIEVVASAPSTARQTLSESGLVEVLLPSGRRIRFTAGTDPRYVAALAGTL